MLMVHMQQTAYKTGLELKPLQLSTHSIFKSTVSVSNSDSISVLLAVVKVRFPCGFSINFDLKGPECEFFLSSCANEMS